MLSAVITVSLVLIAPSPAYLAAQPLSDGSSFAFQVDQERLSREEYDSNQIADKAIAEQDQEEALQAFAEILSHNRQMLGERHPDTLTSLNEYAFVLEAFGRAAEAEPLYAETLRLRRAVLGERHPDTLSSMNNYAGVLEGLGRAAEAEPLYAEVLQLSREVLGERHPQTLYSLSNYALVLDSLGRFVEAARLHGETLRLKREVLGRGHPSTLTSLSNYAAALGFSGRIAEAEPLHAEALRTSQALWGDRHPITLTILNNHASSIEDLGRVTEAEPLYAEVLRLRREVLGERHPDTVISLNNYALVLLKIGRTAQAELLYADALRLNREVLGDRHPNTIISLNNYATATESQGRLAEAESLYAEGLRLNREALGERHPSSLTSLHNYAGVLVGLGRLAEALPLYAEVTRMRREVLGDHHQHTQSSLSNYAALLRNVGRSAEGEQLEVEALRLRRESLGERHPDTLISIGNNAVGRLDTGRFQEALPLSRELSSATRSRAIELADLGLRGNAQMARELVRRQKVEGFHADVLWANYEADQAANRDLTAEAFTALQLSTASLTTQAIADAAASRFASSAGLQALVRERRQLVEQWPILETALVEAQSGDESRAADRESLRNRLSWLEMRIGEIDKRLGVEAPQYFAIQSQRPVPLEGLHELLDQDEAVLFLVPTARGTHSMAVTRDAIRWQQAAANETEIAEAVAALRASLEFQSGDYLPEFDLQQAHSIYSTLIEPVEDALKGKRRVFVIAGGPLSRLPLGVLVTEEPSIDADFRDPAVLRGAGWLADRYALIQLPSLQSLFYLRSFGSTDEKSDEASFFGFGDPVLGGKAVVRGTRSPTLPPIDASRLAASEPSRTGAPLMDPKALGRLSALPGTRAELQQVQVALQATDDSLFLRGRMTERAIRGTDLSRTRILHLATHALTSEEAGSLSEPGLVFTPPETPTSEDDGYLAASEVIKLNLLSAEWVVLSACNTGSPSGRAGQTGVSGLAQAFFYAGAESLLVSHWPVFDDVAPIITVETLRATKAGLSRAEALQAALRKVREDPALDASHPSVWAPFSLVGEGR